MFKEEKDHLWNEYERLIPDIVEHFGISNAVAGLSNHIDTMLDACAEENSNAVELDIEQASVVVEAAVIGTDLFYKASSCTGPDEWRLQCLQSAIDYLETFKQKLLGLNA